MRRIITSTIVLVLLTPGWAGGQTLDDLERAKWRRAEAVAAVARLTREIRVLSERYRLLEAEAQVAAAALIDAHRREMRLQEELDQARGTLEERANAAYRAGPGALLSAYLAAITQAGDFADLHSADLLIEHALAADVDSAVAALEDRDAARAARRAVERERGRLLQKEIRLSALRSTLAAKLARARTLARVAGLELAELERERRRLLRSQGDADAIANLAGIGSPDASLAELLALLGPDGGRGCAIPRGLRDTGQSFSGLASWYGWEFAGRPTASGAIFDPTLFTAAHKTLPLNSFVRVRRDDRCAVVLVNDRGPFIEGRVIDLSMAAAQYLGVGVTLVEVDILARA